MLRLTGGEFRGRSIHAPTHQNTRPTQAKLRQALFNSLQIYIPDARVLDLFAGTGALGFEALSRGAAFAVFVESSKEAAKLIQKNADTLGVSDRIEILALPVEKAHAALSHSAPFEIVLADPPYAAAWELKLLQEFPWNDWLAADGHLCLEWGSQKSKVAELPENVPFLVKVREKNYGDSVLTTYRKS